MDELFLWGSKMADKGNVVYAILFSVLALSTTVITIAVLKWAIIAILREFRETAKALKGDLSVDVSAGKRRMVVKHEAPKRPAPRSTARKKP